MSLADERQRRSRLSLFMAHILTAAMNDGISLAEAKEIWKECAVESGFYLPEACTQYLQTG